jgi:hypothetical protein
VARRIIQIATKKILRRVQISEKTGVPKIRLVIPENKKIIEYSVKKISTNPIDPYSILNPETSSDSPSAKSKGVRLVSATLMVSHRIIIIGIKNITDK